MDLFAVLVPGLWKWPAESKDLRVAASSGYPRFATWVSSGGQTDTDWYNDASAATSAECVLFICNYKSWCLRCS